MTQQETLHSRVQCEACTITQLDLQSSGTSSARSSLGELVFTRKGYRILRCPHCGLMWTDVPSDFDTNNIYTQEYFQGGMPDGYYDYVGSERLLIPENSDRVKLVRSYQLEGKLLDVGCASGGFLAQARKFYSVQGTDVSGFAIDMARRKGLDVDCSSLEESTIIRPPYDAIVLFDTIEHLPSPRKTLERVYSILRENGHVFITTGDIHSLLARACGKYWRLMTPPQHLWFFTPDSITKLLQALGFEIVNVRYLWRKVPLSLIWYQLFRGKAKPLPSVLEKVVLPLNLFDTMTVVARKPA